MSESSNQRTVDGRLHMATYSLRRAVTKAVEEALAGGVEPAVVRDIVVGSAPASRPADDKVCVSGRGLVAPEVTMSVLEDGTTHIWIDDELRPEFWMEITVPPAAPAGVDHMKVLADKGWSLRHDRDSGKWAIDGLSHPWMRFYGGKAEFGRYNFVDRFDTPQDAIEAAMAWVAEKVAKDALDAK